MKTRSPVLLGLLLLAAPAVQAQFSYTNNNGALTITGYTGSNVAVIIPSSIYFLPVVSIGDYAFQNLTNVTSVTIPGSVTNIGEFAFGYCTSLTGITIPGSVISIGEGVFGYCTNLTAITVDVQNSFYSSTNGVLFDKSQTTLIEFPGGVGGNYMVPSSVTSIGGLAFYRCGVTGVTVPDSVNSIGENAFVGCTNLISITIPNSITNIGDSAFTSCTSLTSITIPDGVTSIGEGVFGGSGLTSVTIPDSVTNVGDDAFGGCTSLTSVTIPGSLTSIGSNAFVYCTNLTAVYFQGDAPSADSTVFEYDNNAIVYHLPGTTGWANFATITGIPSMLVQWNPQVQTGYASFGVRANQFGFTITGTADIPIAVEACTNLASPVWSPLTNVMLTNGLFYFSDPQWTNYPNRYYRISWP